ncbi:OmpP1/FadL family transporter [Thalassotalea crassostreae]|uniref:OmpP1/FadL family transporter n=1 Tax=Thalassotalea crassostreae TaxID=1763536 RepID=UPI0008394624|nr:outer membrane protein transport protein [Thalassotalea crassostreae]
MTRNLISLTLTSSFILSTSVFAASPAQTGLFAEANGAGTSATNPAGMTRLKGTHKELQGMLVLSVGEFEVDEELSSTDGGDPDNELTPIVVPGFYYVNEINQDWRFGFSANIPSGFGATNGNDWAGRYYSDEFSLIYVALTPAVAYKVSDKLSIGAAVSFTYNYSETTTPVNNGAGYDDGEMTFEAGALAISSSISMLYEFTDNTRIGLVYGSEGSADLEGDLEFSGLSPALDQRLTENGTKDSEVTVENIIPQRVQFGVYHQFEQGDYLTFDTVWADFSEFGTGDVTFNGNDAQNSEGIYNDVWVASIGYGWPVENNKTYKVGLMHVTSAVDDDKRSFSIPLDRIWGIGAGMSVKGEDEGWDFNVNLYDIGSAPIDTGNNPVRGRVVGDNKNPYALMFDVAYHW